MRARLTIILVSLLAACGRSADAPDAQTSDASTDAEVRVPVLSFEAITLEGAPVAVTNIVHVPGTDADLLLLEKSGEIHLYGVSGATATEQASVVVPDVDDSADCGLISAAFDPGFATNHFLFVGSCVSPTHSRITRHVFDPSDLSTFASSTVTILTVGDPLSPEPWHSVGAIGFEGDGPVLWALFGEKNLPGEAQDTSNDLGSLVRIVPSRVSGIGGATPAADNPFALDGDAQTSANVAAYGLRSPWKGTRDRAGRIFIGDVGEATYEELDVFVPGAGVTPSFGWPAYEGPCDGACDDGHVAPLVSWDRTATHPFARADPMLASTSRRVVWVGVAYAPGATDPYDGTLTDRVLYGDFCAGFVRGITLDASHGIAHDVALGHLVGVTGMAQGDDGFLYASTYGNCQTFPYLPGALYRVRIDAP